jgi:ribose 5-phosphate isomerase B
MTDKERGMKVAIGSDHAGFAMKESLKTMLERMHVEVEDFGTRSAEAVDYPDVAARVAEAVGAKRADRGILICTTGIGMSIVANKFPGVRAALCDSPVVARLSRQHNDANVLALSGAYTPAAAAEEIATAFLTTDFETGGRHERRVRKINQLTGM